MSTFPKYRASNSRLFLHLYREFLPCLPSKQDGVKKRGITSFVICAFVRPIVRSFCLSVYFPASSGFRADKFFRSVHRAILWSRHCHFSCIDGSKSIEKLIESNVRDKRLSHFMCHLYIFARLFLLS